MDVDFENGARILVLHKDDRVKPFLDQVATAQVMNALSDPDGKPKGLPMRDADRFVSKSDLTLLLDFKMIERNPPYAFGGTYLITKRGMDATDAVERLAPGDEYVVR